MTIRRTASCVLRSRAIRHHGTHCAGCGWDVVEEEERIFALKKAGDALAYEQAHRDLGITDPRRFGRTLWNADHVVPIAEGGSDDPSNLRVLCLNCHAPETRYLNARLRGKTLRVAAGGAR